MVSMESPTHSPYSSLSEFSYEGIIFALPAVVSFIQAIGTLFEKPQKSLNFVNKSS